MLIHKEKLILTASSGDSSDNTNPIRGLCRHIIIKPETETTQYDFSITNSDGIIIYERTSELGTLTELTTIPVRGIYTLSIESATVDEDFEVQLLLEE